jgi:hypothetical protein
MPPPDGPFFMAPQVGGCLISFFFFMEKCMKLYYPYALRGAMASVRRFLGGSADIGRFSAMTI